MKVNNIRFIKLMGI